MLRELYVKWMTDERGVTAVEYGLLAGAIASALTGGALVWGDQLSSLFNDVFSIPAQGPVDH